MKTIGLIGGMSWKSTITYYQIINKVIQKKLGGFHSAKILLYSVDFHEIEECQAQNDWGRSAKLLAEAAANLEKAGADFIVICTNTMHKIVPYIESIIRIPLIHIVEATVEELKRKRIDKVALLGTKYTMEQDFYKEKLLKNGLEIFIPEKCDREIVNSVIYNELCLGKVKSDSKKEYLRIIDLLTAAGAQGVILGCTEIGLLINQSDISLPIFDTTHIHAQKAALYALE